MATLIEKSKVGDIPVVWECSECGAVFPTPFLGSTIDEKGALLNEEFDQHVAMAHKKDGREEPRLKADGNLQRCSVCGYPFPADVHPSMSVAFAEHLSNAHKPGETTDDVNQARGV
jgi:hypothetical protein